MSFWTDLAGMIPVVGPIIKGIGDIGSDLGKQQQGQAQGAATEAQIEAERDRNAVALYQAQQAAQNQAAQTDLQRQAYTTANRGTTAKQALIGALMGNYKPTTLPGIRPASGGIANSLLTSPAAQAAMSTLNTQASQAQNTPVTFTGGNIVAPPSLTPLPNIPTGMGGVARGMQLAGAAGPSFLAILQRLAQNSGTNSGDSGGYSSDGTDYGGP